MMSLQTRHDDAIGEMRRAMELEPLSLFVNRLYGEALLNAGRTDEAVAQLQQTVALDVNSRPPHFALGRAYERKEKYAEAVAEYSKTQELSGNQMTAQNFRNSFAKGGWQGYLRLFLENNQKDVKTEYVSPWLFAVTYAKLGEKEKAFEWLEKSYQNRQPALNSLKIAPEFQKWRDDSRFQDLLRRIGLQ